MTAIGTASNGLGPEWGMLDRERIIAKPGFNRWLVPPAALAIHLCIGMAYGFSVFWLPLSRSLGIQKSIACPDLTLASALFTTSCDWRIADLGWMYTLFFVFLGSSAALWGGWLERAGPRKAAVVAAFCWCGGLLISAMGIVLHQLWMLWIGSGVIGGIGLGLGYISPGLDARQMVPRSSRHGHRHGDHGLRRRRHDRRTPRRYPDEPVPHAQFGRRVADLHHHGGHLFRLYAERCLRLQATARGLAAGRLDASSARRQRHDHATPRPSERTRIRRGSSG